MKTVTQVTAFLQRKFKRELAEYLTCFLLKQERNTRISLQPPTLAQAQSDFTAVGAWVSQWAQVSVPWRVENVERRWTGYGVQVFPAYAVLEGGAAVASVSGLTTVWEKAKEFFDIFTAALKEVYPDTGSPDFWSEPQVEAVSKLVASLVKVERVLAVEDWQRCLQVALWVVQNPDSGLNFRAIPVAGVDSKWLEKHQKIAVSTVALIRSLRGLEGSGSLGLNPLHQATFTVVFADPQWRPQGIREAVLSVAELQRLPVPASLQVWVFENLACVRAVPDTPGVVVIHGGGKRVVELATVAWITDKKSLYWGDLDTFGFQILAFWRALNPLVESIMMDRDTLTRFQTYCVVEPVTATAIAAEHLTAAELVGLRALTFAGKQLRLEQERIPWDWAMRRLSDTLA